MEFDDVGMVLSFGSYSESHSHDLKHVPGLITMYVYFFYLNLRIGIDNPDSKSGEVNLNS